MQSEVMALEDRRVHPYAGVLAEIDDVARILAAFQAHLNKTGKVCPKPWCWRRFCYLYKPGYEPPWLSNWWETSTGEKSELFQKQLEYLALQTDRFHEAYQFLCGLQEENWYFSR